MEEDIKTGTDVQLARAAVGVVGVDDSESRLECTICDACECIRSGNSIAVGSKVYAPVLNDREGISRIAVPVVSDPVPAVVGTAKSSVDDTVELKASAECTHLRSRASELA